MAIKAVGKLRLDNSNFETDGTVHINIDIAVLGGSYAANVEAGSWPANTLAAVINADLAAFVKSYAQSEMGETFEPTDTAIMMDGVVMTQSAV